MAIQTAVQPRTFPEAIETLKRLMEVPPHERSTGALERLNGAFVTLALKDCETVMQELAQRDLPQQGSHTLSMHMGGEDGNVWTGSEGVTIDPSQIRLITRSTDDDRHTNLTVTLDRRPPYPTLEQIEMHRYTQRTGEEPYTTEHVVIEFDGGRISRVHLERNEEFGTR